MIQTACPISLHSQAEYHEIDHLVTGLAFVMHNEMGRFLDERLYQHELTARCRMAGLTVHPEMMITVSYEDFIKKYFVDSLLAEGVVIETKTVQTLIAAHKAQTLNYLFLCGTHQGTLLNFRPARVQHEFVSTRLSPAHRHRFTLHMDGWQPLGAEWERLHEVMVCLLEDWGAFLDPHLYREALTHFLGGAANVIRKVPVTTANGYIGRRSGTASIVSVRSLRHNRSYPASRGNGCSPAAFSSADATQRHRVDQPQPSSNRI